MHRRLWVIMLATLMVLSACNFSQSGSQKPGTPPVAGSSETPAPAEQVTATSGSSSGAGKKFDNIFNTTPTPINLQVALDVDHATEAVIPVKGGQLQATGADGTGYTLDIPANSLVQDTKIRMTPVSSISGLPFGGTHAYAIKLQPEGLTLYKDATLTITPPQPIALEKQLFFGYQGDGQNLSLAAPVLDATDLKIRLFHFSGYGATEAEISVADLPPIGGDGLHEILSLGSEYVTKERIRQQGGSVNDSALTAEAVNDLINRYEQEVVKPALQAAGSSCEAGKAAISALVELERTRQLLGMNSTPNFTSDLLALISTVGKVCVQEAYQLCVDKHIIHQMIPLWLGLKREYELLGGAASGPEPEEVKLAEQLTAKCLTFELQFSSRGAFDTGEGGYKSEVKSIVRLQFDPTTLTIQGEAPLDSVSFEFIPPAGCTATSTPGGGTFSTVSLEYVTDSHAEDDSQGYVRDFKLVFWPGVTSESYHVDCPPQGSSSQEAHYTSPPSGYWSGVFFTLHADELNAAAPESPPDTGNAGGMPAMPDLTTLLSAASGGALPAFPVPAQPEGGGFTMDGWDVSGGALFATLEWIKDNGGAFITESGNFKLYHKPGE